MSELGFTIPAGALDAPEDKTGRVLTCTNCDAAVRVLDIDLTRDGGPWIPVSRYVCGDCLIANPELLAGWTADVWEGC